MLAMSKSHLVCWLTQKARGYNHPQIHGAWKEAKRLAGWEPKQTPEGPTPQDFAVSDAAAVPEHAYEWELIE